MSRMGVDQDHEIISESRVLDTRVRSISGGLLRPLEHTVHLIEVDIAEQRGDHSPLWNAAATIGLQHDLQQVQHVIIVDSLRHLGQQPVVPNVVKVATQIKIYDARLVVNDRLGYAVDRFMSCILGAVSKRSRLEVSLKDRLQDELDRTLHHPITDRRNRKNADFAPVLRYLPLPSW